MNETKQNKLLVVVPVMNLWERYTKHMLDSIQCSAMPFEVLLIDNASIDSTPTSALALATEWATRAENPQVLNIIRHEQNIGCAGGWNTGLQFAKEHGFSHILICNNDIILNKYSIDALIERMNKGDVGLVSCVDVSGELPNPTAIFDLPPKEASEAPNPNFSAFLITQDTVDKVGEFDTGFFPAYFEDNDYHYRIKLAFGASGAIATTTSVFYHYGSRTQNESTERPVVSGSAFEKNRAYYVSKWGGAPNYEQFTTPFNK